MTKLINGQQICDLLLTAKNVNAATAIISLNGFKLLYENSDYPIRLIIGTNLAIHPDAISVIKVTKNVECRAMFGNFLHSKFWLVEKGRKRYSIVGSHNSSFSALVDNIETAMITDDEKCYHALTKIFNKLWTLSTPLKDVSQETINASIVGWGKI